MKLHPARRRGGFTLVEMLVVMAIIAILIAFTAAGVFGGFTRLNQVKARNEITEMGTAIQQFESDYSIGVPPPSRIWLDETGTYANPPVGYTVAQMPQLYQLGQDSQAFLRKVWPRIWGNGNGVDWNQNGTIDANGVILEGQQCLVFFLAGAKNAQGAFVGFSSDATNPMNTSAAIKRKGPYYQFDMKRITYATPNGFPWYIDIYEKAPYAYFSSWTGENRYDLYGNNAVLGHDCPSLLSPVTNLPIAPYVQSVGPPVVYYNPKTFQIICAGRDGLFGPGGLWAPADISGTPLADDLSNFYSGRMGTIQ
jgi:prepilin-type N-terminal cleavage/methylation domain-containing protein